MNRAERRRVLRKPKRSRTAQNELQETILQNVKMAAADPIPVEEWTPEMRRMADVLNGADAVPGEGDLGLNLRQMISVTRFIGRQRQELDG